MPIQHTGLPLARAAVGKGRGCAEMEEGGVPQKMAGESRRGTDEHLAALPTRQSSRRHSRRRGVLDGPMLAGRALLHAWAACHGGF